MKYIIVAEDGEVFKADHLTEEMWQECLQGYSTIIDTETMQQPLTKENGPIYRSMYFNRRPLV